MFSNSFLRSFRILLLPFSLLYWLGIGIRNLLYDKKIFRSASFGLPVICVGNLSVGGTGKSPMVEYLVENLKDRFRVATLSRGYKRKTRGYALANENSTALDIGDEPMQFHLKFPEVPVAVGEERLVAIPQLLHDKPDRELIILDDAFQHRSIRAGLNILLTDYHNIFTHDFYLPAGDLRDLKRSYKRAQILIVTKCDQGISEETKNKLKKDINPLAHQQLYFTALEYGQLYHISNRKMMNPPAHTEVLLVTGIANPSPLKRILEERSNGYHLLQYPDHHVFSIDDLVEIHKKFDKIEATEKIILTTEKDAVRLKKFSSEISGLPFYVIPVRHRFLFNDGQKFLDQVSSFITDFSQHS
jgi:tetraacyldisaccharide 4'-kinase